MRCLLISANDVGCIPLYGGRSLDDGFGGAPKLLEKSGFAIWSSCERCALLVETLGAGEILLELLLLLGGVAAA